jgi:hypothetical protein
VTTGIVECVDIEPYYDIKRIVITVRLTFFLKGLRDATPTEAERIRYIADGIVSRWNGHKFKCWDVEFILDWRFVSVNQGQHPANSLAVLLDEDPQATDGWISSETHVVAPSRPNYLSDDPSARSDSWRFGTRWILWGQTASHYAHEVGHILGLDDGYEIKNGKREVRAGHPKDAMYDPDVGSITSEMVTKVIRRSGEVDEARVRCPITLDMGPMSWNMFFASINDIRVHAWACDYDPPSSDPTAKSVIHFKGNGWHWGEYLESIGDPLGLGAHGESAYEVEFDLPVPGDLEVQGEGIRFYGKGVEWLSLTDLPYLSTRVMYLMGPGGELLSTEACFPGPVLTPVFRRGAEECPD